MSGDSEPPTARSRPLAGAASVRTTPVEAFDESTTARRQAWRGALPGQRTDRVHEPRRSLDGARRRGDHDQAALHRQAVEHVARALRTYPWLSSVDPDCYVAVVEQHLQPLDPDRDWSRRQRQAPPGEPVWVGGAVGLHVPRAREGQ